VTATVLRAPAAPARLARAPRLPYEVAGTAFLRAPLRPASEAADLLRSDDPAAHVAALLRRDPELRAAIALTSRALGEAIEKALDRGALDERVALSAIAYVLRLSLRATPFGACATVSALPVGDGAAPALGDAPVTRTRPDFGWLYAAAERTAQRPLEELSSIRVASSGLCTISGDRLRVFDAARIEHAQQSAAPVPTSMRYTRAVALARERAAAGTTIGELLDAIAAEFAIPRSGAAPLVAALIEHGVLVTELRLPPHPDAAARLTVALSRVDPAAGAQLDGACAALRAADREPAFTAKLAWVRRAETELRAIADAPHAYQVDATRAVSGALPRDFAQDALLVFERLAAIAEPADLNGALARALAGRYNAGREVPLLELLDRSTGFDVEAAIDRALDARQSDAADPRLGVALDALGSGAYEIALEDTPLLARAETAWDDFAPAYEAVVQVRRLADGTIRPSFAGGFHAGGARSVARFGDVLGAERVEPLLALNRRPGRIPAIDAELAFLPSSRRVINVVARPNAFGWVIPEGIYAGAPGERTILPEDLVVGVDGERAYLRSLRHGALVHVHQSHMLNLSHGSRIARVAAAISASRYPRVGFAWPAAALRLPYLPRVTAAGLTVAYRTWSVPCEIARDFGGPRALAWRARWNLPDMVYLTERDNRLLLNLRQEIAARFLRKAAARADEPVIVQEAIPSPDDAWLAAPDGLRAAEVAVEIYRAQPAPEPARAAPAVVGSAERAESQRPPGSDWAYAKCYMSRDLVAPFLGSALRPLLDALRPIVDEFHFVRYLDPDFHLRVRLHAANDACRGELLTRFAEAARSWAERGTIARFELGTYDREVERYGGRDAIAHAEHLFTADSAAVLGHVRALLDVSAGAQALFTDVAAFALALHRDAAAASEQLAAITGRRARLTPDIWSAIRGAAANAPAWSARYATLAPAVDALRASVSAAHWPAVARAVLHMHCNRIGVSGTDEELVLHRALALLESCRRRTQEAV
jgi:lantibiotic biosynthesis protein